LPVLQLVKARFAGVERCFAFALSGSGNLCLYEIGYDESALFDSDGSSEVRIQSSLESAALFGRETYPDRVTQPLKRLVTADLFLEQLLGPPSGASAGEIEFTAQYRSDAYPCWVDWKSWTICARSCVTPTDCTQPVPARPHYATYRRLPEPEADCNPLTDRPYRNGYYFQVKFSWTGHAELHRLNAWAMPQEATRNVVCGDENCKLLQCCPDNPFTYAIESGPGVSGILEWDVDSDVPTFDTPGGSVIGVTDV
jgi:hypothetical protein